MVASALLDSTARPVCRRLCAASSSDRLAQLTTSSRQLSRERKFRAGWDANKNSQIAYLKFKPTLSGNMRSIRGNLKDALGAATDPKAKLRPGSLAFSRRDGDLKATGDTLDSARARGTIRIERGYDGIKRRRDYVRSRRQKLGLVPTMGALHEGHLSLIRAAAEENDVVWVSIFVNPTQFGPTEDLSTYPRTMEEDMRKLVELNKELHAHGARGYIGLVFNPSVRTMYPSADVEDGSLGSQSYIIVNPELTGILEGAARPTFFRGVATVVMKLFNLIKPDNAYFGQKDVQQLSVIQRMKKDFMLDVHVQAVPIARDPDGLAMSSRNVYLGERRRRAALVLNRALSAAEAAIHRGMRDRETIIGEAVKVCRDEMEKQHALPLSQRARFEVEYISLAEFGDLKEIENLVDAKTVVLSGTIIMMPLEKPQPNEVLGIGGDAKSVRLLDNVMWWNPDWQLGKFRRLQIIEKEEFERTKRDSLKWDDKDENN